jgi:hypothetical protein
MATRTKAKAAEQVTFQISFTHPEDGNRRTVVANTEKQAQKQANAYVNEGHGEVELVKITYTTEVVPIARDKD